MPNFAPSLNAALVWGGMFTVVASTLDRVDAVHLTAVRYLAASAIFLALLAAIEGRRSLRLDGRLVQVSLLGTLGFAGFDLLSSRRSTRSRPSRRRSSSRHAARHAALPLGARRRAADAPPAWLRHRRVPRRRARHHEG